MAFKDWFIYKSKAQREKEEKEYRNKMFPLGMEQKDWELSTIAELIPKKKKDWPDYHFCLLILRQDLYNTELERDDSDYMSLEHVIAKWRKNKLVQMMDKGDALNLIMSMAVLENAAHSFEELPTSDKIREGAERIAQG